MLSSPGLSTCAKATDATSSSAAAARVTCTSENEFVDLILFLKRIKDLFHCAKGICLHAGKRVICAEWIFRFCLTFCGLLSRSFCSIWSSALITPEYKYCNENGEKSYGNKRHLASIKRRKE